MTSRSSPPRSTPTRLATTYTTARAGSSRRRAFRSRRAWLLTAAKAREYDLLIGMDDSNMADLRRLVFPEDAGKVRKLLSFAGSGRDIADPWYTGNFDETYADVLEGCTALLKNLIVFD